MATASSSSKSSSMFSVQQLGDGPKRAFHAGCVIKGNLYIHGGIDKKDSTAPLNDIYCLNLESGTWSTLSANNSPALSHHTALNLHDRYVLLIGGWNGKVRASEVFAYDTDENRWLHPSSRGFPHGAGLSSHATVLLSNGDVLAIGREGGLRTQRRSGNAFLLKGNIRSGFTYTPHPLGVSSRSGHTAHILGSNLVVYGGRGDKVIEIHAGYKAPASVGCGVVDKLQAQCKSLLTPMTKPPCGRKHHVAVATASHGGALFIHGGETFDGRSREPVGELYLLTFKPTMSWYKLGNTVFGRSGHVAGVHGNSLVVHGGEGTKGSISSQTFRISIT